MPPIAWLRKNMRCGHLRAVQLFLHVRNEVAAGLRGNGQHIDKETEMRAMTMRLNL